MSRVERGLAEAIAAFENEYLPSGLRETPEWRRVRTAAGMVSEPHLIGCPARYQRNEDCICGYTATGKVSA